MNLIVPGGKDSFVEYATANETTADVPIDMHQVLKTKNMPRGLTNAKSIAQALVDVDWLPFAAEAYGTSSFMKDYIIVPTTIFLTDLPNANMAAFPFEEMSSWNTSAGCITYKTWKAKPTHEEHANDDPSQARGIIFDSSMRLVPNYVGGLHRVVLLAGWDRNRFPNLAKRVEGGRHGYSMGCFVQDYECSVCGASLRSGGCCHIHPQKGVLMERAGEKLVYRIARGCTGFELSAVKTPAWRSAVAEPIG